MYFLEKSITLNISIKFFWQPYLFVKLDSVFSVYWNYEGQYILNLELVLQF